MWATRHDHHRDRGTEEPRCRAESNSLGIVLRSTTRTCQTASNLRQCCRRGQSAWLLTTTRRGTSGKQQYGKRAVCPLLILCRRQHKVLWSIGEACDVPVVALFNNQNIVFPVATGAGLAFRDCDHRLHRYHRARLQYRIAVLAQLKRNRSCAKADHAYLRLPNSTQFVVDMPLDGYH